MYLTTRVALRLLRPKRTSDGAQKADSEYLERCASHYQTHWVLWQSLWLILSERVCCTRTHARTVTTHTFLFQLYVLIVIFACNAQGLDVKLSLKSGCEVTGSLTVLHDNSVVVKIFGDHLPSCAAAAPRDRTEPQVLEWLELAYHNGWRKPSLLCSALWQPEVLLADNPYEWLVSMHKYGYGSLPD